MTDSSQVHRDDPLGRLAAQKQQELRELQEIRIQKLLAVVEEKDKELTDLKNKFQKLKDDFKYNLKLLTERDAELEQYDTNFSDLKVKLSSREGEVSDLKIKIDTLEEAALSNAKSKDEMKRNYEKLLQQRLYELEHHKSLKEEEMSSLRKEMADTKKALEKKMIETEEEARLQKHELTCGFEEVLRKREHEFRVQTDEMRSTVLAHELKIKLLMKEMEHTNASKENTLKEMQDIEGTHKDLQAVLRQKEWEIEDLKAVHNSQVSDLQESMSKSEQNLKKVNQEYCSRYEDFDKKLKAQEMLITRLRDTSKGKESELQAEATQLRSQLDSSQNSVRQLQSKLNDLHTARTQAAEKFQVDLSDACRQWESQLTAALKENEANKSELMKRQEDKSKLMAEINQKQQDIERYKKELQFCLDHESELERSKAQAEIDWQRRLEEAERKHYERSESLIESLTRARDEALAQVKVLERDGEHKDDLNRMLTGNRSQQISLKAHQPLQHEFTGELSMSAKERLNELEKQNRDLKQVIRSMRQEMEQMGSSDKQQKHMEKNVDSGDQIEEELKDHSTSQSNYSDNMIVKSHMKKLNEQIGSLRKEKVELTALLRKQQTKIQHMEEHMEKITKQPQEKQVEIDQLQYAMGAASRRHDVEMSSLRQRLADVELQAAEARKEADEYHHACLQSNTEAGALREQVAQIKIQLAEQRPTVNFGAQELMIQQLQDEISRLQQQLKSGLGETPEERITSGKNDDVKLKKMLHQAVKRISQLTKEKQQLIEVGNRLRAELNKNGLQAPSAPLRQPLDLPATDQTTSSLGQKIENKLKQLEQLQYQVTKKELSQNLKRPTAPSIHGYHSSSETDPDDEPRSILKKTLSKEGKKLLDSTGTSTLSGPATGDYNHDNRGHPYPTTAVTDRGDQYKGIPVRESIDSALHATGFSISSIGAESIQEVWRMLDEGISPPVLEDEELGRHFHSHPESDAAAVSNSHRTTNLDKNKITSLTVEGQPSSFNQKQKSAVKLSPRTSGRPLTAKQKKQLIRNYNIKEDMSDYR